jgi:hypothetical protein
LGASKYGIGLIRSSPVPNSAVEYLDRVDTKVLMAGSLVQDTSSREAKFVLAAGEAKRVGKAPQLPLRGGMEGAFGALVMGDGLSKVESVGGFGHEEILGADGGQASAKRSLSSSGLTRFRPPCRFGLDCGCARRAVRPGFSFENFIVIENEY